MKNKFKSLFAIAASLFVITSCSAPDEYLEKTGDVNNKPKSNAGESLEHPIDEDAEGYYIPYKYWTSGEITELSRETGQLWSFEAKGGQEYAVYLYDKNMVMHVFEGNDKRNIEINCLTPCEKVYKYTHKYDLYLRPALIKPKKDGKYYLKVLGTRTATEGDNFTGMYDICVTKGRDGESAVELTLETVAESAWVEGQLLFNKKDAWFDYINNTTANWVDFNCYKFEVSAGDSVVLYGNDKDNGGSYTARIGITACYWNGSEYEQIFKEGYEYADNDSLIEGYPFIVPQDISLEDGQTKKYIYWYVSPALQDGANSIIFENENIGTYSVAAQINGEYINIEFSSRASQYQLIIEDAAKLTVGAVFNPFEFATLKKYDDTTVSVDDENLYIYWGDGFEKLTGYSYLLCKDEKTESYLEFGYPTDGTYYYYSKNVKIKAENERSPKIEINITDPALFCVGNFANATISVDGIDYTSTAVWTWYNPNAERPTITDCESKGVIPCYAEGSLYIIVQEPVNGDIVYKEVTVKPESENPYRFEVDNEAALLNTVTYSIKHNGSDVTSQVTAWTFDENNFADFDSITHSATYYRAGMDYRVTATLSDGTKIFKGGIVADKDTFTVTPEKAAKLTTIYNTYGGKTASETPLGTSAEEYNITMTGAYSDYTYSNLVTWLKYVTVPINLDMTSSTGITGLDKYIDNYTYKASVFYGSKLKSIKLPTETTTIPAYAFANTSSGGLDTLVSVTIPSGVTTIDSYAFYETKIEEIIIPDTVTKIGYEAFYSSAIKNIEIPSSVTYLGTWAFWSCRNLETVVMNANIETLPERLFADCYSLNSVHLSDHITKIGIGAFEECHSLVSITLPTELTQVQAYAFRGCHLTSIAFPTTIASIANNSFSHCSSLATVTFADGTTGLTSVGGFDNCTSLTSINIPEGVTSLGSFENCTSLTSINIPDSVTGIGGFKNCTSLTTVKLPSGLKCIIYEAFYNCPLTSIKIPSKVTFISNDAFYGAKFSSVTIPESVEWIAPDAFDNCINLSEVTFEYDISWSYGDYATSSSNCYSYTITDSSLTIKNNQNCNLINMTNPFQNAVYLTDTYKDKFFYKDVRLMASRQYSSMLDEYLYIPVKGGEIKDLIFWGGNNYTYFIQYECSRQSANYTSDTVYDYYPITGNDYHISYTDATFSVRNASGSSIFTNEQKYDAMTWFTPSTSAWYRLRITPNSDSTPEGVVAVRLFAISTSLTYTTYNPQTANSTNISDFKTLALDAGTTNAYNFYVTTSKTYYLQWLDSDTVGSNSSYLSALYPVVDAVFLILSADGNYCWWGDSASLTTIEPNGTGYYKLYIWTNYTSDVSGNMGFRIYSR